MTNTASIMYSNSDIKRPLRLLLMLDSDDDDDDDDDDDRFRGRRVIYINC